MLPALRSGPRTRGYRHGVATGCVGSHPVFEVGRGSRECIRLMLGPSSSAVLRCVAHKSRHAPSRSSRLKAGAWHAFCALGREAQPPCWASEVVMRTPPRPQLKRNLLFTQWAHAMRHESTQSESALWAAISRGQLLAPALKLVVEVDGGSTANQ